VTQPAERTHSADAATPARGTDDARVVLLDGDPMHARSVARVLRSVVASLDVQSSVDALEVDGGWDLLVANYDSVSAADRERFFDLYMRQREGHRLLIYTRDASRQDLPELLGRRGLQNLLALRSGDDTEDLLVTIQKILRKDIFGIRKYFPWGATSASFTLRDSRERADVVEQVRTFAEGIGVPSRLLEQFCLVADELTSNALYNAPVDAAGQFRYAHTPRTQSVTLDQNEHVDVEVCSDGRRLGVSIADPFGSLTSERVVEYLAKCFRGGADQVDQKPGGAGLGLYQTFEALSHFVINVCQRRRTEMIGLLDVRGTYRDFVVRGKSFNIFVEE
jgi:hypothetical protein